MYDPFPCASRADGSPLTQADYQNPQRPNGSKLPNIVPKAGQRSAFTFRAGNVGRDVPTAVQTFPSIVPNIERGRALPHRRGKR